MTRKVNAFSSQEDQEALVSYWRRKANESENHFNILWKRVQCEKGITEAKTRKIKWLEDLKTLQREEEKCLTSLGFSREGNSDFLANDLSLCGYLRENLKEIDCLAVSFEKSDAARLASKIISFQGFLEKAIGEVDTDLADSSEISISFQVQAAILAVFSKAREQIDRNSVGNESDHFLRALALEKEEVLTQLQGLNLSFASNHHVLLSAQCLIEISNESRKQSFQLPDSKVLTHRLQNIFPHLTPTVLSSAIEEAILLKKQTLRLRNLLRYTKSITDDIVASHNVMVQRKAKNTELQQLILVEEEKNVGKKEYLASKLEMQRKTFYEKKARLEQEKKVAEEELAKQKKSQVEQRLKEFFSRLKLLEEYEKRKKDAREKEKEILAINEKEELEEKQLRIAENGKRVAYRQKRLLERQREHEKRKAELDRIHQEKENAILRFFQSIQEKMGVEASFERVLQSTKSSEQSETYTTAAQIREGKMFGYSDEKIMRDPRVRLYHALLGVGLHKSEYGRQKITEGYNVPAALQVSEGNPFAGSFA